MPLEVKGINRRQGPQRKNCRYGFFGASRYLSATISKYINSEPLASATPVMSMLAPRRGELIPPMSKKRNPDWVECGSTALAANCEESISSISFLLTPVFTLCGSGIGLGRVLDWGFVRRR